MLEIRTLVCKNFIKGLFGPSQYCTSAACLGRVTVGPWAVWLMVYQCNHAITARYLRISSHQLLLCPDNICWIPAPGSSTRHYNVDIFSGQAGRVSDKRAKLFLCKRKTEERN